MVTVILMRPARQLDEALMQNHLQTLQRAHGNLLVLSGRSACYVQVLALANSLNIQTLVFEQELYDPQQIHGARWIGCSIPMRVAMAVRASTLSFMGLPLSWRGLSAGSATELW